MGVKETVIGYMLQVAKHGDSWWMPLVLLLVVSVNSLTGGIFVGILGVMQSTLFTITVMSRKYTWFLGPMMLCCGGMVAALTYMQIMSSGGVEALLAKTGLGDSSWMAWGTEQAAKHGFAGLVVLSLTPAPTVVVVIAGMLAKIPETTILVAIFGSRLLKASLTAAALRFGTEGKSAEEFIREQFGMSESEEKEESKEESKKESKKEKKGK
mmetsp:Transcript_78173/g.205170  ORF Transcript_78173/g.205170 Transcript_78173/m.205170 type:complete len:211 (-) Transcript_78173:7-639(-)